MSLIFGVGVLRSVGLAECLELRTGRVLGDNRLKGPGANSESWSSLVPGGDSSHASGFSGDTFVLRASPELEVLATDSISARTLASPAISRREIFVRAHERRWCNWG